MAKRAKVWERRLMKDFHLAPVAGDDDLETLMNQPVPENEDVLDRFRRVARLAVLSSTQQKWSQVVSNACAAYVSLVRRSWIPCRCGHTYKSFSSFVYFKNIVVVLDIFFLQ